MSLSASASSVKFRSNFSLNFACAFVVSGDTPSTVTPFFVNFFTESRN